MEWYEILVTVVGAVGGVGGIGGVISIYMAKSNKTKVDIGNMQEMLNEAHKMYDEVRAEKNEYKQEFFEYRDKTNQYIEEFKERFSMIESKMDAFERTILLAYRCQYPENIKDCPVIKRYEETNKTNVCNK
jgi:hypothetical protein